MLAELKVVERPKLLGDQVYETLRQFLRTGQLMPGQPLQEALLAEQLGVSRTPVREALQRLAGDQLLVSEGRSYTVPVLGERDIDEIYALRFLLEPEALRGVAELQLDRRQLAALLQGLDDMVAAHLAHDGDRFMDANYRYRDAWTALVPNRRLVRAIEVYADHVRFLRVFTLDDAAVREVVLAGLRQLMRALETGDGAAAAAAMHAHLTHARQILLDKFRTGGS